MSMLHRCVYLLRFNNGWIKVSWLLAWAEDEDESEDEVFEEEEGEKKR